MIKRIYIIFCAFLVLTNLNAQQLRFKHLTNEDGLSSLMVNCIIQDDQGFMWFGTQDGLNKYDGYQFKIFKNDPTNRNSLNSSDISCINQFRKDLFIIGTREGVNFLNPVNETLTSLNNIKALKGKINSLAKQDEHHVWVGGDNGLFLMDVDSRTVKSFNDQFGQENIIVKKILVSGNTVYVGTEGHGLWLVENGTVKRVVFEVPDHIKVDVSAIDYITDIKEYAGKIYLGTNGQGLFKMGKDLEIESRIITRDSKELDGANFIKCFEIRDNKLYIGTTYGFFIYNLISEKLIVTEHKNSNFEKHGLGGDKIESLFIDQANNIWLGLSYEGVNISFFQSQKFPTISLNSRLKFENIYAFCETRKREVMIGGIKTLVLLDENNDLIKNFSDKLKDNTALCIYNENDRAFWIGTYGRGLFRLDRETGVFKEVLGPKLGGTILCLKADGRGNLYAGSIGDGLFKINMTTCDWVRINGEPAISDFNINTIYEDKNKNVWIGTYDGGLVKTKGYDNNGRFNILKVYKHEDQPNQIASNIILGLNEDSKGNLWVATSAGLSKFKGNDEFYNFYEKDGLPNSYLYSILKDSLNNFWMSSNKGLIKFNPMLVEKEIIFKSYDTKDGLLNSEYNIGAAYQGHSGLMYFGGLKGFNSFRPSAVKDNFNVPKAYIVGYKRGGTDVVTDSLITYKKNLKLSWTQNYFQFELAALDYTDPSKNKFKYKLEGYDEDWSAPTNVRYISYTELPGGDYVLKVKAANNDGVWNETPLEISITVVPPFWKTKIFYVLVILFVIGGFYAYTQYRTNIIKKENRILENKVAERTKELAEKNRDITSSIEYAKRIQEAILPAREQIFSKLKKVFILYQPKDIVSGDFYWFGEKNDNKIFAVVDCTGHGVPGAFMSMIGHNLLHQIIQEKAITEPGEILNYLHKGVQEALRQGQNEINTNDGMDVSIISINNKTQEVKWAGANRPLILIDQQGNITKYDGNKFPVGGAQLDRARVFTTNSIKPNGPSMAYMFTDGYADQFGGDKGKKFMVKRFNEVLATIHLRNADEQREELLRHFEQWRSNHEQVDDVLVIGVAI